MKQIGDEFCHSHSVYLRRRCEQQDRQREARYVLAEFADFVQRQDSSVLPAMEEIATTATPAAAAEFLRITRSDFRRLSDRLCKLGQFFVNGNARLRRSTNPKPQSALPCESLWSPKLTWRDAQTIGERLVANMAAEHHFTVTRPYGLAYIPEFGVYTYDVRGSNDIRGHGWDTGVWVDGNTGALRQVFLPSGQHSGNTVSTWLWGLHYGDIRDFLPYRILVALFGLILTMLSITGVYIWWKKRKTRVRPTRTAVDRSAVAA